MTTSVPQGVLMGNEGLDPRNSLSDQQGEMQMTDASLYQSDVNSQPLDVYMYYAAIEREREDNDPRPVPDAPWTVLYKTLLGKGHTVVTGDENDPIAGSPAPNKSLEHEKDGDQFTNEKGGNVVRHQDLISTKNEHALAYRLLRNASWQAVFYLITTDILGFSSAPESFQQLGYGPGVLVYTFFFILAVGAGQVIYRLYLALDSEKYPVKCYADLGERTFGRVVRHIFNIVQSFQLVFNVALLIIGNGQTLASLIEFKFCYIALNVFFAILGGLGGQIRSLRNFAWFANINIWLNIIVMLMTMIGIAKYAPVPGESNHTSLADPIIVAGWVPSYTKGWYQQVSGVQLAVFAYGGAMIFTEFMAEMRRPKDFWKAAFVAQLFCYLMYMFFGLFCYSFQGQYSSILPALDFANRGLSLGANIIGLVSTAIASVLYANIGVKVLYENVLRAYFHAPELVTPKGRIVWTSSVIVYWALAWVIGSAIPNITALVTLVGAACILQFTYTFPPILLCGHWMQRDALLGDQPWEPGMAPGSNRIDTWRDLSRWKRGFLPYWYYKVFLILLFLGALSLAGLGIYSGIETAIVAYAESATTAFSCIAPGQT
ncbi:hypothetical protein FIBSPDRAFT_893296 [Athelia psychrophila]|uniref:Amino acid transporter transmembrane domain-containing protein n=1 Tax=Athelia psychrophila TaxID=1759441 RepID=A0A166HC85_9AGAM|nr:hypothetical protein FIBSPDRAFT_893296 [Fibularhizoctonia sp. CBS 109695]